MDNNKFILEQLLAAGERPSVIIKQAGDVEEISKAIVALANGKGGTVLLGVTNDRRIIGIEDAYSWVESLKKNIKKSITPKLPYSTEIVDYDGHDVIMISVWEGVAKPYLYELKAYISMGSEIIAADNKNLLALFDNRAKHDETWERERVYTAGLEDLDMERVASIHQSISQRNDSWADISDEEFLSRTGLVYMGAPTNASLVLFGKFPARFIPQIRIRVALYGGKENNHLLEVVMFEGNLFDNLEQISDYCKNLYGTTLRIDGLIREQVPRLPEIVFREALLNAMVHRDYSSHKSFLNIMIYSDNIQISNYGSLLNGITVDSLMKEHLSILRNPDIANICYLCGYIETAGSGTLRILNECQLSDINVKWTEDSCILTIKLDGIKHLKNERTNDNPIRLSNIEQQKTLDSIIVFISHNPGCKLHDVQSNIGKSTATIKRYIQLLKENGIITYEGSLKTGGYKIL